jgi:hypothetical protein
MKAYKPKKLLYFLKFFNLSLEHRLLFSFALYKSWPDHTFPALYKFSKKCLDWTVFPFSVP